jgi:hypothetical protein
MPRHAQSWPMDAWERVLVEIRKPRLGSLCL